MSYSAPHIDESGIHVPDYDEILEYLIGRYKSIFGEDIDLNPETPDYQMISIYAKCMSDSMGVLVDNYNARNPNYASGDSLDVVLEINGIRRREATSSTCVLKLTGAENATIAAGDSAIDVNGYIWTLSEDCELDASGVGYANSICTKKGNIEAPAGTINSIFSSSDMQWIGVTNESAAIPGKDTESDSEVKLRRYRELVIKGYGLREALHRALIEVENMEFVNLLSNDTGTTDSNGIPGHSICAVVYGGEMTPNSEKEIKFKNDVAAAIWENKSPGTGTYGTTEVTYVDPDSHESTISFIISDRVEITVSVTVKKLPNYDSVRVVPKIKKAIMNEINNLGPGNDWNVTMAYKDIYVAFDDEDCPFVVNAVTGKKGSGSAQTVTVDCDFDEIFYATESSITITETT